MKLYQIEAQYIDSGGTSELPLWVRANTPEEAFSFWVQFFDIDKDGGPGGHDVDEDGPYTLEIAEREFDEGYFGILERKTYTGQLPAPGAVSWTEVDRLLTEAL